MTNYNDHPVLIDLVVDVSVNCGNLPPVINLLI